MRSDAEGFRGVMETLRRENEQLSVTRDALMLAVGEESGKLATRVHAERVRAERAERELGGLQRERDEVVGREERLREEVEGLRREAADLRARVGRVGGAVA